MTGSKKRYRVVCEVGLCVPGLPHVSPNPHQRWSLRRAPPRPLMAVCALLPACRRRGAHAILAPLSAPWRAGHWFVARAARALWPSGGAMTAHGARRPWAALTPPPVRPRSTPSGAPGIGTRSRRPWGPGPTRSLGVCSQGLRCLSVWWLWRGKRCAVRNTTGPPGPPSSRRSRPPWASRAPNRRWTTPPMRAPAGETS